MKKRKLFLGVLLASAIFGMAACSSDTKKPDDINTSDDDTQKAKYEVTFDSNGGSDVSSQLVEEGSKVTRPTDPTRAATASATYDFAGWYKDQALTAEFNFDTETITAATTIYAKWTATPVAYTVTFNYNNGDAATTVNVNYNSTVSRPTDPTRANEGNTKYAFAGWYTNEALTELFDFATPITGAISLYAKWEATDKVSVIFDTNGGSSVDTQLVFPGEKVTAPTAPTKTATAAETYTFAGWYKDAGLQNAFDFDNDTITTAITLYAKWTATPVAYTVTFDSNGGTNVNSQSVAYGEKADAPTAPTKTATAAETYTFAGWYKDAGLQNAFDFDNDTITEAITLYAKWTATPVEYVVTFNYNNGDAATTVNVNYNSTVTRPTDPTKANEDNTKYAFAGWYTNEACTESFDFATPITGAISLYAKWEATDKVSVIFNTNGGSSVDTQLVFPGEKATRPETDPTKTADAQYTYTFGGWYADSACTQEYDFNAEITTTTTIYAKWNTTTNEYEVTFVSNGGTMVDSQTISYGEKATEPTAPSKEATAAETYTFAGWYTDSGLTQAYDFATIVTGPVTLYAKWTATPVEYTITFNTNGGTTVDSQSVAYGQIATEPTAPTKAATAAETYTFAGWYTDSACTQAYDFNTTITSAFTLYAKWTATPVEYTVTFNTNGGTTVDSQSIAYGQKVTTPTAPTKDADAQYEYEFAGWYTDSSLQTPFDFDEDTITEAITLYAKWATTPVEYQVAFDVNGGTSVITQSVAYGEKVTKPADPTKEQTVAETYTFAGWYKDEELQEAFDFDEDVITSAITLYAKWTAEAREYTVTFNPNGGTPLTTQKVKYGETVETPVSPTRASDEEFSYEFIDWSSNEYSAYHFDLDTPITGDITLYACYVSHRISYQVTFDTNGGTSVDSQSVEYGKKATLPSEPTKAEDDNYTYEFVGWYKDSACTQAFDFDNDTITAATTIYAKWTATPKVAPEPDKFLVTFESNGGSSVAPQQISENGYVSEPTEPTRAADVQNTYEFAGWYTDSACTQEYDFNTAVTSAFTLYAKWTATPVEYTITFNTNGGTSVDSLVLTYGSVITRPADPTKASTAAESYEFAFWCTNAELTKEFKFDKTVTESMTLYARWIATPVSYTVTFDTNGGTSVDSQSVEYGKKATAPTAPTKASTVAASYTFAGWYKDSGCTQAFDFDNDTITAATTIYAKWNSTPIEYTITFISNGGTTVDSQSIPYGQIATEPTAPTKAATAAETYTFAGWYTDSGLTQAYDFATIVTGPVTLYAKWTATPVEYTITFNTNGGTTVDSQSVAYGQKVTTPTAPTKAATAAETYTFAGWYTDSACTQAYDFNTTITSAFTLYAKWTATPVEYTVTFNTNGGTTVDSQSVAYGQKVTTPTAPTKAADADYEYEFAGWYTDSGLTQAYDFNSTVTSAFTLYAKWTATPTAVAPEVFVVTFNSNGGTAVDSQEVEDGGKVSKPANPTKAADSEYTYEFAGWYKDSGLSQSFSFTNDVITADITLYAKWNKTAIVSEDQLSVGFGEGLTPWTQLLTEANIEIPASGNTTIPSTVSYNGFTFTSSKHRIDITTSGAVSYNSQSSTITFTVGSTCTLYVEGTWASGTAGKVYLKQGSTSVYTSANSYASGEDLSFNIELAAGTYTISSDKSIRLTKLYKVVDLVTVTYNTEHGSVTPSKIEKGSKLSSLPELYEEGYVFGGWYSNAACTQEFSLDTAISTNTTLYAKWTVYNPDNYVTVTFDTGLSSENIDPVVITKNTKLDNVPELTLSGYRFDGWYTDSSFTTTFNPNANITASMTLYAKFVQQFTVTFKYEDNTTISTITLDKDEHINSTDIPTPKFIYGYEFDNWYNGNSVFDFNNTAITANITLVAKYNEAAQSSTVQVTASGTSFESLYAEFLQFDTATEYAVYVKSSTSNYTKIDDQLIRKYQSTDGSYSYYRADAVGLKAGTYTLKIVPIINNAEATSAQTEVGSLAVEAHDRSGFGFVNGSSSGAYNDDGTLKSNAQVVYVTNSNKDTVTLGGVSGVQNIIIAMKKQKTISTPVAIRFLGNIEDPANMPNGDLYLDDVTNLTVEGIGTDATMNGFGIVIKNSSNVEIRNLGFMNCNSKEGDDCGLQQENDHVWVHNCDFFYGDAGSDSDQAKGDGALDTKKSTYVTHSYNHFWDNGKCNLQGMKDETTSNYITYHHNWYDHSDSRHPRIRTCTVHIYNNYFDGNAKYGVGVTMGASAFVESNYFRSTATMKPMLSSMQGTDALGEGTFSGETGGIIKAYNNTFDGNVSFISYQQNNTSFDAYVATSRNEQVASSIKTVSGGTTYNNFDTASTMYSYTAQTPSEAKATVMAKAGRVQGGDFKWTFNNSTEDSNYAVITALKTALTNYSSKLLSVQGSSGNTNPDTSVSDVIAMIDALPNPSAVTESDRTAIMAAKEAYDALSSTDQASVTNSDKLTQCIAALPASTSFTIDYTATSVSTGNNVTIYDANDILITTTKVSDYDSSRGVKFNNGYGFTINNNSSATRTFVITFIGNGGNKSFTYGNETVTFGTTAVSVTVTVAAGSNITFTTSTGGAFLKSIVVS